MAVISFLDNYIELNGDNKAVSVAKNKLFYLTDQSDILNFYTRGSSIPVFSCKFGDTEVDGQILTKDNVDSLLSDMFASQGGGGGGEYVLPKASATRLGGVKVGNGLSIDANGVLSATGGEGGSVPTFDLDAIFAMSDEEKAAMFPTIKAAIESGSFIAYGTLESEGGTLCFANKAAVEGDDRVFFECYGSHYSQPSTIMVRTYRLWSDGNAATEDFSAEVGGGGSSQPSVYFIEFQDRTATGGDADWAKLDEMYNRAAAGDFGFILNVKYDGVAIGNLFPWEAYNEDYNGNGVRFHFMYVNSNGKVEYGNHSDWSDFMVFKNEEAHTIRCEKISKTIENGGGSTALNLNDIKDNWSEDDRKNLYNDLVSKFTNGEYFNATFKGESNMAGEWRMMGNPCISYDDGYGAIGFNFYCEYGGVKNYFVRINSNGGFEDMGI